MEELEAEIASNPTVGNVIQGLSGARKVRISMTGRGKFPGSRATYVLVVATGAAYLLLAYTKKDQKDLSTARCKGLAEVVTELTNG